MAVKYDEKEKLFVLDTKNTTYIFALVDDIYLCHVYYGSKIDAKNARALLREDEAPFIPSKNDREKNSFFDSFNFEYPQFGMGDYRESVIAIRDIRGFLASEFEYVSHNIKKGKENIKGLPSLYAKEDEASTLTVRLYDRFLNLELYLKYTIFEDCDAIVRLAEIKNKGTESVYIEKILSACLDMEDDNFELLSLYGSWARERHIQRSPLMYGRQNLSSFRGESSHQEHPFIALVNKDTTQKRGKAYGMNFIYSGNFIAQVEKSQFDSVRMSMGISPVNFKWKLQAGEAFCSPEVVMIYSGEGLGKMTRSFHDLYRKHLIRGVYRDKKRPILINNWEATYFDFNAEKLIDIAKEASKLGIEMLVMDDGWFGKRNDDSSCLGDWFVNEDKIGKLGVLVKEINSLGMKFGIWFEPEMISPNSDLFREHPDFAIQIEGRSITKSRSQYVLDLSRKEVRDLIYKRLSDILKSANIEYVKWDMNRQLTTLGSQVLPADKQGELYHRYMLGVYELQERLICDFPYLLLENCSGGGARFDAGMLYYSPQIWCSDDTDAIERLSIQEGTALIYPISCIGSHVSICPNHIVGRTTPFITRGNTALAGTFGYELDITKLSEEEKEEVKEQIENYHKYNHLVRNGDYYRLESYGDNSYYDSFMLVGKKKDEGLLFVTQILAKANVKSRYLCLEGLDSDKEYEVEGRVYKGNLLMNAGIRLKPANRDFESRLIYIREV